MTTPAPNTSNSGRSTVPTRGSNTGANQGTGTPVIIPTSAPAGQISFTQPPQFSTSFFKIAPSQPITFAWNATGILATPTSLTVEAVGTDGYTHLVGPSDGRIPGGATSVVWDVYSYRQTHQETPLGVGLFTLRVHDDRGMNAPIRAGYLTPNQNLKFALYTPQSYTPLASGWSCNACNGALSNTVGNPLFMSLVVTFLVMFLSGFSLIRQRR
ncbi:hypothetical protein E1B28_008426 [Marasmius oreades]|uniref:DUF7137 domain-containing protein n=1 Tax=Marasmius oreades TaxID=181124 RepID=A0A9P7USD8_9AGAR|nr:uncharacterized protein E1B28_008426 [Marasmius oreades]KAG7092045.1 hypothetical protein E1B28_008426 [Marasmius oreades]